MDEQKDFFDKVDRDKNKNKPLFNRDQISNIHEKIISKIRGEKKQNNELNISDPVQKLITADMNLRNAVKDFAMNLENFKDKNIAQQLIAEHIFILNEIFKKFE